MFKVVDFDGKIHRAAMRGMYSSPSKGDIVDVNISHANSIAVTREQEEIEQKDGTVSIRTWKESWYPIKSYKVLELGNHEKHELLRHHNIAATEIESILKDSLTNHAIRRPNYLHPDVSEQILSLWEADGELWHYHTVRTAAEFALIYHFVHEDLMPENAPSYLLKMSRPRKTSLREMISDFRENWAYSRREPVELSDQDKESLLEQTIQANLNIQKVLSGEVKNLTVVDFDPIQLAYPVRYPEEYEGLLQHSIVTRDYAEGMLIGP